MITEGEQFNSVRHPRLFISLHRGWKMGQMDIFHAVVYFTLHFSRIGRWCWVTTIPSSS